MSGYEYTIELAKKPLPEAPPGPGRGPSPFGIELRKKIKTKKVYRIKVQGDSPTIEAARLQSRINGVGSSLKMTAKTRRVLEDGDLYVYFQGAPKE